MTFRTLFITVIFMSIIFSTTLPARNPINGETSPSLIPLPDKIEWLNYSVPVTNNTNVISTEKELRNYLIDQVNEYTGLKISKDKTVSGGFTIFINLKNAGSAVNNEEYSLIIDKEKIEISAFTAKGLFNGIQTLFQLIPSSVKTLKQGKVELPACRIWDKPAFSWRGLNFDCCRHFMSKDFIKRYIDILAYYKFNTLHWHLTEDQGWRIEIKKYPNLTKTGAWRKEADGSVYGGFYTQEDIKEIVAYAQSRFVNIVPEIEMPGHSLASLASYPQNSCTGGPFEVTNVWGVLKDVYCPGRDSTFYFLQDVLDEVIALFPGKYIHIGGDEAPKDRWKACPKCQLRMKQEGLKNEHELQSYFIKRISAYIQSKGKTVIGWDEILQGGLAPGVIVQSWQSFEGAVESAKLGHYTICSPASHTYLNGDPENLDLRIAYSFKPCPDELTAEEKKFIIGGEANIWTENAPQNSIDSKLFPRILALAEVFWHNPLNSNYDEFYNRVQNSYKDLSAKGIEYGREGKVITTTTSFDSAAKEFTIDIIKGQKGIDVRYTTDDSDVTNNSMLFQEPIKIKKSSTLKIAAFRDRHFIGKRINLSFDFHKALNARLTYINNKYDERYRASGENGLIDGIRGTDDLHDGCWQGFEGTDLECVIDLGKLTDINEVSSRFLLNSNSFVFLPSQVEVSLSSDNLSFGESKIITHNIREKTSEIILKDFNAQFNKQSARYIKLKAVNIKKCPDWHPYAGSKTWLFADEISVK